MLSCEDEAFLHQENKVGKGAVSHLEDYEIKSHEPTIHTNIGSDIFWLWFWRFVKMSENTDDSPHLFTPSRHGVSKF